MKLEDVLKGMVDSSRVPHAILFYEEDGGGAMEYTLYFLQLLFREENRVSKLIHPDIHYVFPVSGGSCESFLPRWREMVVDKPHFMEKDMLSSLGFEGKSPLIPVDEAKRISSKLAVSALEGGYRAVVIYLPEKLNDMAANKLLKLVEEPPQQTQFVFITHAPDKVLTTISSRCQCIRVQPETKDGICNVLESRYGIDHASAIDASEVAFGSVGRALDHLASAQCAPEEQGIFYSMVSAFAAGDLSAALRCGESLSSLPSRENAKAFCKFASDVLRKVFLVQQKLPELASVSMVDREMVMKIAGTCKKTFPRAALPLLDRARYLIDRNINIKVLFTDLVCKLYRIY